MTPKPQLKPSRVENHKRRSNHLRLVVNQERNRPRATRTWILGAGLLVLVLTLAWNLGMARRHSTIGFNAEDSLAHLSSAFQQDGIEGYLLSKARLREKVRGQLQDEETPTWNEAQHLAVLLFPELLPDSDFEKNESESLFRPQIDIIESKSRSSSAREAFDFLRADLWNYENASHEEPQVSRLTEQFLDLFDQMSRE